jgi:hypothetical protein
MMLVADILAIFKGTMSRDFSSFFIKQFPLVPLDMLRNNLDFCRIGRVVRLRNQLPGIFSTRELVAAAKKKLFQKVKIPL